MQIYPNFLLKYRESSCEYADFFVILQSNMKTKHLFLIFFSLLFCAFSAKASTSIISLEDSLNAHYQIPPCVPKIHVTNLRIKGSYVNVYTNPTLSCVSFSPTELTNLRRQISYWVLGSDKGKVSIFSNHYELGKLITTRYTSATSTNPSHPRWLTNNDKGYSVKGGLADKHIALWPSHGYYYNLNQDQWRWQRATMWSMVEDIYTAELANHWLVPMLENAGAYVFEPRERDTQLEEIIVLEPDTLSDQLTFTLAIKQPGTYGVYIRYRAPLDKKTHTFSLVHGGITTEYTFNPNILAGTWQWVGEADFTTLPEENYLLADTSSIEGIRLGGGFGSIERYGQTSGLPRWTEGARYWLEYAGYPDSIWSNNNDSNDYRDDLQSRGYWVNYLNEQTPIDMSFALHTDGYSVPEDSTIIGTLALYTHRQNRDLTDYIQTQVVNDLQAQVDSSWTRRELRDAKYCETNFPVVPSVLLEVLSHKNFADIQYALDPKVQFIISRAIYKGILRGLNPNKKVVVQPLPVQQFKIDLKQNQWQLRWTATVDSLEPSATASFYILYTRKDGGSWDNGKLLKQPSYTFSPTRGIRYDFRVVAGNAGGISMPSEVLSAYLAPQGQEAGKVLILNAFHQVQGPSWFADSTYGGIITGTYPLPAGTYRAYIGEQFIYDRSLDWTDDDNCGWGMCRQDHKGEIIQGNTFDYPCLHGQVLAQNNFSYVSGDFNAYHFIDTIYDVIDIICGLQSANNLDSIVQKSFAPQTPILISGAALGHLRPFIPLSYALRAPQTPINGQVRLMSKDLSVNSFITFQTRPNAERLYTPKVDILQPTDSTKVLGRYIENGLPAILYEHGRRPTLVYSFPIESSIDFPTLYLNSLFLLTHE